MIGQIVGGRFEVVRLIGKGGMGSIYEVRNTRLGRSFALKTLTGDGASDTAVLQRFRREADVIARIKHPNIVEVIDWEQLSDGSPAMVMEYLQGEDLAKRIAGGPLQWPQIARIADQVLAALSVAHANGVVHRDLKPQNIFLAEDGSGDERVKLLDFGVSKVRDSKSLVTTDARLLGTPAYMAPEQADGRAGDIGTHTDVWATGSILQEMATGELAFDANSLPSILYKVCHGKAAEIEAKRPDAPAAFVELVRETLTRDIDKRISDATVLRVRLREALRSLPGVSYSEILPAVRAQTTPSGRRERSTGARTDTAAAATPTSQPGAANTVDAPQPTPSLIQRRRWAPVAAGVGALAMAMVVIAIIVATRGPKSRAAPRETPTVAKPTEVPADAGTQVVEQPTPDASVATAAVTPPPRVEVKRTVKTVKTEATHAVPTVEPAKVEPAKRKPCAKDDFECLYGDGT